jgi:cysteine synthase A
VFVESNTTGTGQIAVQRLLSAGNAVTFMTRSRAKYTFLGDGLAGLRIRDVETNDAGRVVAALRETQARMDVDAVLTFSDFYVDIVAEAAARCGLRGLDPCASRTCRDKYLTRCALRAAGLLTPRFWLVCSSREARRVAGRVRYPCVVKPPTDSSSHGVRMVASPEELLDHYRVIRGWGENVRGQRLDGHVLVESLVEGPEYSVETLSRADGSVQVVGVTDKHLSDPPHFVELGHDFPSGADESIRRALEEATLRALAAVRFDFGPAHTELRWTAAGPVVIEINGRLAGGMIPELVRYATGIDLLGAWFDLLLGRPAPLTPSHAHVASIRFLTAAYGGRLADVTGIAEAYALGTIREVMVTGRVGARVRPAEDAYDRLGFVIGSGVDRAQVVRDVAAAAATIRLEVDDCRPAEALRSIGARLPGA